MLSLCSQDSKIDMLDTAADVQQKLKKVSYIIILCYEFYQPNVPCPQFVQAFCEPEKVEGNGVLAFARYVLFPILAGDGKLLLIPGVVLMTMLFTLAEQTL